MKYYKTLKEELQAKKMKRFYQLIGWYGNIKPDHRRQDNISDGALFSTEEKAKEYAKKHNFFIMSIRCLEVEEIPLATLEHIKYCETGEGA